MKNFNLHLLALVKRLACVSILPSRKKSRRGEMVDALDSKSCTFGCVGSSPTAGSFLRKL
jgi:hypothetical protein